MPSRGAAPVIVDTDEPELQKRMERALAARATLLLPEARTPAVDVGNTTLCLARRMGGRRFDQGVHQQPARRPGAGRWRPGGLPRRRPVEQAEGGSSALARFGLLWFGAAVIGCRAVTADGFFA